MLQNESIPGMIKENPERAAEIWIETNEELLKIGSSNRYYIEHCFKLQKKIDALRSCIVSLGHPWISEILHD